MKFDLMELALVIAVFSWSGIRVIWIKALPFGYTGVGLVSGSHWWRTAAWIGRKH